MDCALAIDERLVLSSTGMRGHMYDIPLQFMAMATVVLCVELLDEIGVYYVYILLVIHGC